MCNDYKGFVPVISTSPLCCAYDRFIILLFLS